jgi:hypothetical protein
MMQESILGTLRDQICRFFDLDELANLCQDLGIDFEDLAGDTREGKARELILYSGRHACLSDLVRRCRELRPKEDWPPADQVQNLEINLSQARKAKDQLSPALRSSLEEHLKKNRQSAEEQDSHVTNPEKHMQDWIRTARREWLVELQDHRIIDHALALTAIGIELLDLLI